MRQSKCGKLLQVTLKQSLTSRSHPPLLPVSACECDGLALSRAASLMTRPALMMCVLRIVILHTADQ